MMATLPAAWIPREKRRDHAERKRMRLSPARVKWLAGARRSGKSTDGLDYLLIGHGPRDAHGLPMFRGAMNPPGYVLDPTYVVAAPTREMVKRLWWKRIKARLGSVWVDKVNETELTIDLVNGAQIICLGMDRPTRGEGFAIDGLVGDEFAYWKAKAFEESLRPAMSTVGRPPGWGILMGKPAGRNHFFESWQKARDGKRKGHDAFHWPSSVLISPEELAEARDGMDERSFQQEYEASFLTQTGLVFYKWDRAKHLREVRYDSNLPLVFCFDFNVSPGAAAVLQEQFVAPVGGGAPVLTTCVIDEFYKADDSNTPLMCQELAGRYAGHAGAVFVAGDVGGHQRRTSADSTDWKIIEQALARTFRDVRIYVGRSAPDIVDSVCAVNSRLQTISGLVQMAVHPKCEHTVKDFEGVVWDERKSTRDIDKRDRQRTHWTDAIRYYVAEAHPIATGAPAMTIEAY